MITGALLDIHADKQATFYGVSSFVDCQQTCERNNRYHISYLWHGRENWWILFDHPRSGDGRRLHGNVRSVTLIHSSSVDVY